MQLERCETADTAAKEVIIRSVSPLVVGFVREGLFVLSVKTIKIRHFLSDHQREANTVRNDLVAQLLN